MDDGHSDYVRVIRTDKIKIKLIGASLFGIGHRLLITSISLVVTWFYMNFLIYVLMHLFYFVTNTSVINTEYAF